MLIFHKWIPGANTKILFRETSSSLPGYQAMMSNQAWPLDQTGLANKFHS